MLLHKPMLLTLLLLVQNPPSGKTPSSAKPSIRIDDRAELECGFRGLLASQKALDAQQLEALADVQKDLLSSGFRSFADPSSPPGCFQSTRAYWFVVLPAGGVVGVVVLDNGTCHEANWVGADRQLLYEWSPRSPLKIHVGEQGASRAAELERLALRASQCR